MKNLRNLTVLITLIVFSLSNANFCYADDLSWIYERDEAFKKAKEQDKHVLLFFGTPTCANCKGVIRSLTEEPILRKAIDEEYILWYSNYLDYSNNSEAKKYVQEYVNNSNYFPYVFIINPYEPDVVIKRNWGLPAREYPGRPPYSLNDFLSLDLPLNEDLKWNEDKDEVFNLAKNEGKLIFKFVGKGTSSNSQKVIKLLNESPLKELIEKDYILWYSKYDDSKANAEIVTQTEIVTKTPPFIYIIDPNEPDRYIVEEWGNKDTEALNNILIEGLVSNENISLPNNKVTIYDNMLYISNNTDNEVINIYSITGQKVYTTHKKAQSITINASSFPNGILIIHSLEGWSSKVMK